MNRLRVGVIGCGMVAQLMHLPYLRELDDDFEIDAVCDLSGKLVNKVADVHGIEQRFTDYQQVLNRQPDVVFILTFYHSDIAVAAAERGIHIFVEKPMAFSPQEAERMVAAAAKNKVALMVGYMKRYDPGYLLAQELFRRMTDIKLIRVHDLCFENALALASLQPIYRYDDISSRVADEFESRIRSRLEEAVGAREGPVATAYRLLLETGSHDINILRGAFGNPDAVLHTDIWQDGNFVSSVLDYGRERRCLVEIARTRRNWADEELTAYGMTKTVSVKFPVPFNKNAPTVVSEKSMLAQGEQDTQCIPSYDEAFKRELEALASCLRSKTKPLTDGEDALQDTMLMADIIKAYSKRSPT